MLIQFQYIRGDFSGIIKELDRDSSTPFRVDDKVYGQSFILFGGSGSFAELALVNLSSIGTNQRL
jgi:hypothetical protein